MRIHVGSKNKTKVDAVAGAFAESASFKHAKVSGVEVVIPEFGQPKTFSDTVEGAKERARQAFKDCDLGVGIEGGIMPAPHTKSGYIHIEVCVFFDGKQYHMGLAPSFEWPKVVIQGILEKGLDGSQAIKAAGITTHDKIGVDQGSIFLLSKGTTNRTDMNKWAVMMALIHLENPELY